MSQVISITDAAKAHIKRTLAAMSKPMLFFGLRGGGCAGFEYYWEPTDELEYSRMGDEDRDEVIDLGEGQSLILDCTSLVYVLGSEIDYETSFAGSQLVVRNPLAKSSCGCGTSISL
jgi:iron-sulfur cluster assembly accessory protein